MTINYDFTELFTVTKGSSGLTEEAAYMGYGSRASLIPMFGGNETHITPTMYVARDMKTVSGSPIRIFKGDGIILSMDGSAGSMTYIDSRELPEFTLNHHAAWLEIKETAIHSVSPKYFAIFGEPILKSLAVSDGSKTLSLKQLEHARIPLPSLGVQEEITTVVDEIYARLERVKRMDSRLMEILSKQIIDHEELHHQVDNPALLSVSRPDPIIIKGS